MYINNNSVNFTYSLQSIYKYVKRKIYINMNNKMISFMIHAGYKDNGQCRKINAGYVFILQ